MNRWRRIVQALTSNIKVSKLDTQLYTCMRFNPYRNGGSYTPFTLALLIRSETGFAPLRAFTLHQLIRINNLIRIKLNHLLEVVSHRFSLLRDQITSVDANRTRTKEEQIEINARGYICIYGVACQELSRSRSSARLSTKYHCKLSVAIL